MILLRPMLFPLVLLFLLTGIACAENAQPGFADALFTEGDYFRAITEYKRFLYEHPDSEKAPRARLNIARCYLHGHRWEAAEKALHQVIENFPGTPEADTARILQCESAFKQGDFSRAIQTGDSSMGTQPALLDQQQRLRIWALAYQGDYSTARTLNLSGTGLPSQEELLQLEQLPVKSPALAGTLSAVFPGAGQLYAKRYREAGLAFLLNAAFIAGGLQAVDTGNEVLGGILLFFEAGWYGGNIYNAMNSVHKYNRDLQHSLLESLRQRHQFSLLLDENAAILQLSAPLD